MREPSHACNIWIKRPLMENVSRSAIGAVYENTFQKLSQQ